MPVVNPGIRRFLGSAIQRLFNSASFYATLTHSLVPERGTGSPTFTRASTATVTNNDGYLVTALAGEARFEGARRVRNLLGNTENLLGAGWTAVGGAPVQDVVAPDGTTTGWSKALGSVADEIRYLTTYAPAGRAGLGSVYLKGTGTVSVRISNYVDQQFVTQFTLTSDWARVPTSVNTANSTAGAWLMGVFRKPGDTATSVDIWHPQLEDVTAQTTQTAGEYISVGVESAPYYHGSMVDGVKCFPTDLAGNPIPSTTLLGYQAQGARTNLCLQSNAFTTTWTNSGLTLTQNATGPDGGTTAWTATDDSAVALEFAYQNVLLTAATYTFSIFVKKTVGAQTSYPMLYANDTGASVVAPVTIDTTNGVATAWTAYTSNTIATGLVASCVSYNDDFWRVSMSFTGTARNWAFYVAPAWTTNAAQSTGTADVTAQGSAVFYGAQVELGSFASSYIATTTLAVARNADVLTYSSAGNIDGTKGWCYAEAGNTPNKASLRQPILATYPSGNGLILNNYTATDPASVEFYDGSAFRTGQTYTQSVAAQKFAASWGTGVRTAVGGSVTAQLTFDGDAAVGTVFAVGNYTDGTNGWFGTIRNVRIGQRQLSSSELQAVTR